MVKSFLAMFNGHLVRDSVRLIHQVLLFSKMIVRVRSALAYLATLWQGLSFVVNLESLILRHLTLLITQIKEVSLNSISSIGSVILPETDHICQLDFHVVHLSVGVHMIAST